MPKKKLIPFPDSFQITAEMESWFDLHQPHFTINLKECTEQWENAARAKGYEYKDWKAAWRNAMLFAQKWHDERSGYKKAKQADLAQKKRTVRLRDDSTGLKNVRELMLQGLGLSSSRSKDVPAPSSPAEAKKGSDE
jgi:hypothetical protein